MRIVSWNIHGNTGIGQERREAIVTALASRAPDVIVLQEVT